MTTSRDQFSNAGQNPFALPQTPSSAATSVAAGDPNGTSLVALQIHLHCLQIIQRICESPARCPSFRLTIADVSTALLGLDRYFAPLFAHHQIALHEVHETLRWVIARFSPDHYLEDVIQSLCTPLLEVQYQERRAAR